MTHTDPHAGPGPDTREPLDAVSRRRLLGLVGAGSATVAAAACTRWPGRPGTTTVPGGGGACRLTPEQTEGPYYIDTDLVRADITEGRPGAPLRLAIEVVDGDCTPRPGAAVDIWHCDAAGNYSGFGASTGQRTFLRGVQMADEAGRVEFRTIYPGWYVGRAVHIHVKVHTGGRTIHTGQLYFDEALNDQVLGRPPYNGRTGNRTRNASDFIFRSGGDQTLVACTPEGDGFHGQIRLAVT